MLVGRMIWQAVEGPQLTSVHLSSTRLASVTGPMVGTGLAPPLVERSRAWWIRRSLHHRERNGRYLSVLLVIAVVAVALFAAVARWETLRRSSSAPIAIRSTLFQPGGGLELVVEGTWIDYTYEVEGKTYIARDFRQWLDIAAHRPKVCYAPSDPGDHFLVSGWIVCGRDARP